MWTIIAALKPGDARWIFVSAGILALLVIVGGLGLWYYRKKVLFPDDGPGGGVWTFEDLRRMRDSGELTEEEYQSLRASLIGGFQARPKPSSPPPDDADQPVAPGGPGP